MSVLAKEKIYTIKDIEGLPEDTRAELIDGQIYMQAAPLRIHQRIISRLLYHILAHIDRVGANCDAYVAPFAVYLDEDYVEPDISVICDPSKLTDKGCVGAPDWIIEVLSPSTARNDYFLKANLYARAGVRLYWIVDPAKKTVRTYYLSGTDTQTCDYPFDEPIPVPICDDGFSIRISDLL